MCCERIADLFALHALRNSRMARSLPRPSAQFLRFLAVGVLNSTFGYGCFALLMFAGLHYAPALLLATVAGVLFNFKTTGALVFKSHDNRLIYRFVASYLVVYLVNLSGIKLLTQINIDPYYGGAMLILPMAALAFILFKRFVFAHGQAH